MGRSLSEIYDSCLKRLAEMHVEAVKTLNLLALLIAHPQDQERRTALKFQRDRETKAQDEYKKCSQALLKRFQSQ